MDEVGGMTDQERDANRIDLAEIERLLREALAERAARYGIDRASITSPAPGAVIARTAGGDLLRMDVSAYRASDLNR